MGMTTADWQSLADASAAGGGAYLTELAKQAQAIQDEQAQLLSGLPGGQFGSAPSGLGASTSTTVGQNAIDAVQSAYPNLAWMLGIPELAPLIIQAAQTNMDPNAFQAEFESTNWYKTQSQSVRNWIAEVETDPGQAASDLNAQKSSMAATLAQMGVAYTDQQLTMLSQQSLAMGWTPQEVKDEITKSLVPNGKGGFNFTFGGVTDTTQGTPGTLQSSMDQITAEAAKYLVPISSSTVQSFALAMAGGTMDTTGVDAYLQAQASSLYPSIAGAIKSGVTPADYVTPYKEVAAQLLGVDPNSIDMTQQKYNRALTQPGPDGKPVAMSLYDWQQMLMQDPQYGYNNSVNAKDRASSIAQGLAEMFGKTPSGPAGSTAFAAAGAPRIPGVPIT